MKSSKKPRPKILKIKSLKTETNRTEGVVLFISIVTFLFLVSLVIHIRANTRALRSKEIKENKYRSYRYTSKNEIIDEPFIGPIDPQGPRLPIFLLKRGYYVSLKFLNNFYKALFQELIAQKVRLQDLRFSVDKGLSLPNRPMGSERFEGYSQRAPPSQLRPGQLKNRLAQACWALPEIWLNDGQASKKRIADLKANVLVRALLGAKNSFNIYRRNQAGNVQAFKIMVKVPFSVYSYLNRLKKRPYYQQSAVLAYAKLFNSSYLKHFQVIASTSHIPPQDRYMLLKSKIKSIIQVLRSCNISMFTGPTIFKKNQFLTTLAWWLLQKGTSLLVTFITRPHSEFIIDSIQSTIQYLLEALPILSGLNRNSNLQEFLANPAPFVSIIPEAFWDSLRKEGLYADVNKWLTEGSMFCFHVPRLIANLLKGLFSRLWPDRLAHEVRNLKIGYILNFLQSEGLIKICESVPCDTKDNNQAPARHTAFDIQMVSCKTGETFYLQLYERILYQILRQLPDLSDLAVVDE